METYLLRPRPPWALRALGRNPLVRTSDRIEALMVFVAVAVVLLAVPVAGALGTLAHDKTVHTIAEQARQRHPVVAEAVRDSETSVSDNIVTTTVLARWQAAGVEHRGALEWDSRVHAGDHLEIWVDDTGNRIDPPMPPSQAGVDAFVTGFAVWLAAVAVAVGSIAGVRVVLDTRRRRQWSRELDRILDSGGRNPNPNNA